jgi:hypothetical protein
LLMALERERDDAVRQVDERDRVLAERNRQIAAASGRRLGDRLAHARRRVLGAVSRRVRGWMPGR